MYSYARTSKYKYCIQETLVSSVLVPGCRTTEAEYEESSDRYSVTCPSTVQAVYGTGTYREGGLDV